MLLYQTTLLCLSQAYFCRGTVYSSLHGKDSVVNIDLSCLRSLMTDGRLRDLKLYYLVNLPESDRCNLCGDFPVSSSEAVIALFLEVMWNASLEKLNYLQIMAINCQTTGFMLVPVTSDGSCNKHSGIDHGRELSWIIAFIVFLYFIGKICMIPYYAAFFWV